MVMEEKKKKRRSGIHRCVCVVEELITSQSSVFVSYFFVSWRVVFTPADAHWDEDRIVWCSTPLVKTTDTGAWQTQTILRYKDGYFHLSTHLNEIPKALQITRSFHTVQHIKICMLRLCLIQQSINQSVSKSINQTINVFSFIKCISRPVWLHWGL